MGEVKRAANALGEVGCCALSWWKRISIPESREACQGMDARVRLTCCDHDRLINMLIFDSSVLINSSAVLVWQYSLNGKSFFCITLNRSMVAAASGVSWVPKSEKRMFVSTNILRAGNLDFSS